MSKMTHCCVLQIVTDWQLAIMGMYAWIQYGLIVDPGNHGVHWCCSNSEDF